MSLCIVCCLKVISTLLQEIQIYSIQTVDKVVLGLARKRYSGPWIIRPPLGMAESGLISQVVS